MRTFIAVEISEEVRKEIVQIQEELKKTEADVKWVESKNMHLTLKFLGEVEAEKIELIKENLRRITQEIKSFEIAFQGLGVFPNLEFPRVVWVGIEKGKEEMVKLAMKIDDELQKLGFPKERRPFSCHLTLGRVRSSKNRDKLKRAIKERENFKIKSIMDLKECILFRSQLTPAGPIYTALAQFNLSSTPGVEEIR
ncbi:MAG: RNA 2',3'-cyclic phosphodiesterase [Candidatus Omnitrophica bacterium]|nr:RNA 2',3'-cyclic phosphodiesterase [Candidatus Omnitrophota bacterium]MCM8798122.1 RNA 2',3'-cyclic phosphodiesterase [Candidatus Omnitrophota bacterium]